MPHDSSPPPEGANPTPSPGTAPLKPGWRQRVSVTPEGGMMSRTRPPKGPRPPRPGKREREQVQRGERPFYRPNPPSAPVRPVEPAERPTDGRGRVSDESYLPSYARRPSDEGGPRPMQGERDERPRRDFRGPPEPGGPAGSPGRGAEAYPRTFRRSGDGRGLAPAPRARDDRRPPSPPAQGGPSGTDVHRGPHDRSGGGFGDERSHGAAREPRDEAASGMFRSRGAAPEDGPPRGYSERTRPGAYGGFGDGPAPRAGSDGRQAPPPPSASEIRQGQIADVAAHVIQITGPEKPADAALRETLRARRDLPPGADREVALAVFAYFRWRGWLDPEAPLPRQLSKARDLAANFRRNPSATPLAELRRNAAPPWVAEAVNAPAGWWRAIQMEPPLWLRARPGTGAETAAALGAKPGPLADSILYTGFEDLFRTDAFHAGRFEIQDIASQAVGWICRPLAGEWWWDACAGEGGKTLHLAALMGGQGLVWASDRAEWRLDRLRRRSARAGCFNYRSVLWDGGSKPPTKSRFHGVLVDAPCSGIGTWGRNPHARWSLDPEEPAKLAAVQTQLLKDTAPSVKSGGRLVYAVCTVTAAETTDVAAAFTQSHAGTFEPLAVSNPLQPTESAAAARTLWPHETPGNAMFVAVWKRR